jgi:hypothetical protein
MTLDLNDEEAAALLREIEERHRQRSVPVLLKVEGVVDREVHAEEALGRSSRFEPLHLALSSPYRLMRILGAIILAEPLLMGIEIRVTSRIRLRRLWGCC